MKPLGMTPTFQVVFPTPLQDAIYETVEKAIDSGVTVEMFRREAAGCWQEVLRRKAEEDAAAWGHR